MGGIGCIIRMVIGGLYRTLFLIFSWPVALSRTLEYPFPPLCLTRLHFPSLRFPHTFSSLLHAAEQNLVCEHCFQHSILSEQAGLPLFCRVFAVGYVHSTMGWKAFGMGRRKFRNIGHTSVTGSKTAGAAAQTQSTAAWIEQRQDAAIPHQRMARGLDFTMVGISFCPVWASG
jgi:hypothetical protein